MQSIDLDEWVEFEAMVEANGPSMILDSKEEIVFRGSEEKRTLEYVRHTTGVHVTLTWEQ